MHKMNYWRKLIYTTLSDKQCTLDHRWVTKCRLIWGYCNVRITAYVVKVFSMAHSIIGINEQQVCDPLLYLVKNKFRHREKIYVEDNPVYSTTMTVRHLRTHSKYTTFSSSPCFFSHVNYWNSLLSNPLYLLYSRAINVMLNSKNRNSCDIWGLFVAWWLDSHLILS